MKLLFKRFNKKNYAFIIAAIVIATAFGATYAWFTTSVSICAQTVSMGRLKVSSTFESEEENLIYEPGLSITRSGSLINEGSIPVFVAVSADTTITKTSDSDGNAITPGDPVKDDPNVQVEFDQNKIGYKISGTDGADSFFWYKDKVGNYYILLDGNAEAEVAFEIAFNGPGMGNEYQGAEIAMESAWIATQALPDAIVDELGVDFDSLEFIGVDLGGTGLRSGSLVGQAEAKANSIWERAGK